MFRSPHRRLTRPFKHDILTMMPIGANKQHSTNLGVAGADENPAKPALERLQYSPTLTFWSDVVFFAAPTGFRDFDDFVILTSPRPESRPGISLDNTAFRTQSGRQGVEEILGFCDLYTLSLSLSPSSLRPLPLPLQALACARDAVRKNQGLSSVLSQPAPELGQRQWIAGGGPAIGGHRILWGCCRCHAGEYGGS